MVWLQCNERYDVVGQFDPSSCVLKLLERTALGNTVPAIPHGFFSHFGNLKIGVYGLAGKLFLVLDDHLLQLDAEDTIEVSGPRAARHLRILTKSGKIVTQVTYSLHGVVGTIPNDPTPFVEEEDFDIGLLASNVSKDLERRTVFTNK